MVERHRTAVRRQMRCLGMAIAATGLAVVLAGAVVFSEIVRVEPWWAPYAIALVIGIAWVAIVAKVAG